jgi:dUTP pyrophosphatase
MPRSGLGFKYGVRLANTIGNIDSDYWQSDNEGHIMLKIVAAKDFSIKKGDRIAQGVILPYFTVDDDEPLSNKRNGGFGSTDKR